MKSLKWREEQVTKGLVYPTAREGHTITYLSKYEKILLFGGISSTRMNDLYILDIRELTWETKETTGRQPSSRAYHTAFYDEIEDNLFIYGGQADKSRSQGDFYMLSLKTWVWKKLFLNNVPQSRHHHTLSPITNHPKQRIMFGGICLPENIILDDVWLFNFEKLQLQSSIPDLTGAESKRIYPKGDAPSPRRGHTAITVGNELFIFGGKGIDEQEDTSIIYALSFDNWVWRKVNTVGKPPSPRSFTTADMFTNNRIVFFGGLENETSQANSDVFILQTNDNYWAQPFTAERRASQRYHHASCLVKTKADECFIVILGGLDQKFCSMKINILYETDSQEKSEWEKLTEPTQSEKLTREKASQTILDYKQYIHSIDEQISQERYKNVQLMEEKKRFSTEVTKTTEENQKQVKQLKEELTTLEEQNQKNLSNISDLFMLIKQEQLYGKQIQQKNNLLENTIYSVQGYMVELDKFVNSLNGKKWDESDTKDKIMKQLKDTYQEEINKGRDEHKESLLKLKRSYEKAGSVLNQCNSDIDNCTQALLSLKKDYEEIQQILCETENEEDTNQQEKK